MLGAAGLILLAARAWASEPVTEAFAGTRALGMGGGLRGAATGGTGPLQNPSGMSLVQSYNVEADYLFARLRSGQLFHASIVDSTSAFKLSGGFYYTYHFDDPPQPPSGRGHEAGLALAIPFGDHVAVGGTVKYLHLTGFEAATDGGSGGVTFDAGVTVRVLTGFTIGLVGSNLRQLGLSTAPLRIGYGVALTMGPELQIVADGVTNLTAEGQTPLRKGTRLSAGIEATLAKKVALRGGGGYDGITQNGFFTAGVAAISEAGTLDLGLRQDVFQGGSAARETVFAASFRLFVPQP
jgi:hypothetical protein